MAPHTREWSFPAPARALLWWPGVSFVLVIVSPDTVEATLVASGVLLAVTGGFVSMAGAHLRAHRAATGRVPTTPSGADTDPPTTEFPTIEVTPGSAPAAHSTV